jgi:hypothetical protein
LESRTTLGKTAQADAEIEHDAPLRTKAIQVPDISFFVMEVAPLATELDGTAME